MTYHASLPRHQISRPHIFPFLHLVLRILRIHRVNVPHNHHPGRAPRTSLRPRRLHILQNCNPPTRLRIDERKGRRMVRNSRQAASQNANHSDRRRHFCPLPSPFPPHSPSTNLHKGRTLPPHNLRTLHLPHLFPGCSCSGQCDNVKLVKGTHAKFLE